MDKLVERWREAAATWQELQSAANLYEGTKGETLAEIMSRTEGSSQAEKERNARLTQEWRDFNRKRIEAVDKARGAKLNVKYREMQWQTALNQAANDRAEQRAYGA